MSSGVGPDGIAKMPPGSSLGRDCMRGGAPGLPLPFTGREAKGDAGADELSPDPLLLELAESNCGELAHTVYTCLLVLGFSSPTMRQGLHKGHALSHGSPFALYPPFLLMYKSKKSYRERAESPNGTRTSYYHTILIDTIFTFLKSERQGTVRDHIRRERTAFLSIAYSK